MNNDKAPGKSKWLKRFGIVCSVLLLALVAVYFLASSAWCLKSVILPRVSKAAGATITVEGASLSPFSSVSLTGLTVQTTGAEPLFKARRLLARYSLWAILHGNISLSELALSDPEVRLVVNADGTSNLDPFTKKKPEEKKPVPSKPGGPPLVDLKKLAVENGLISYTEFHKDGSKLAVELAGLNVTVADLKNGQTAKLDLRSSLKLAVGPATNVASLAANLSGAFRADLGPDLTPRQVKGDTDLAIGTATGAFADAAQLETKFTADLGPTEIKQLALNFTRAGTPLGLVNVSGPFDLSKQEGKLKIKVTGLGNQALSLVGGRYGIFFGDTQLAADYDIELANRAQFINTAGTVTGDKFSLTRGTLTTPVLDFQLGYSLAINLPKTNAVVRSFTFNATQAGQPLLKAALLKEMQLDWGKGVEAVPESTFELNVNKLELAEWKAFLGTNVSRGTLNAKLTVNVQKAGKLIGYDLTAALDGLSAQFGGNRIAQAGVDLGLRGQLTDFSKLNLAEHSLRVTRAGQTVVAGKSSGQVDTSTMDLDLLTAWEASLPQFSELLARPDLALTGGALKFTGHVTQKNQTPGQTNNPVLDRTVAGSLQLADLTGRFQSNRFDRFEAAADLDLEVTNNVATIRKCAGALQQAGLPGGGFDVTGRLNRATQAGEVAVRLTNLNQNVLRSFAAPLAPMTLVSVLVSANATAQFDAKGGSSAKGDLQVANLLVSNPADTLPKKPLAVAAQLDAALQGKALDLRLCKLGLGPTDRATNELALTGKVDLTKSNAITGAIKLAAESLDLTPCYDMFVTDQKATAPAAPAAPASGATASETEPPAVHPPLRDFTFDAEIGKLFLREIAISNLVSKVKVNGGKVDVNPFQLVLNGAPVSAESALDVGVPGCQYAVSLNADRVPLEPFVNSFQPARKGQLGGTVTAHAQVKGAGVTGASLQKNLAGQFSVGATNLNLQVVNVKNSMMKSLLNVIVAIPDLIRNPTAKLGSLLGSLTGNSQPGSGGWVDDVTKSPIDTISLRGKAGDGKIQLEQASVQSAAFLAVAHGDITLAPILTNSTVQLPVEVSLRRPLADKVGLAGNTPTNEAYAKLPDFVTMKGTVGNPKPDISYGALAGVALKAGAGIFGNVGGNATTNLTGLIGGFLGGGTPPKAPETSAGTTPLSPPSSGTPTQPVAPKVLTTPLSPPASGSPTQTVAPKVLTAPPSPPASGSPTQAVTPKILRGGGFGVTSQTNTNPPAKKRSPRAL